jgi:hypothetical protein
MHLTSSLLTEFYVSSFAPININLNINTYIVKEAENEITQWRLTTRRSSPKQPEEDYRSRPVS